MLVLAFAVSLVNHLITSDDDGDGLPDESDITNDGWFELGENWGDWGIDGQPAVLLGGAPGAPIPVIGGHIDGGDADIGEPVNCTVVVDQAYFTTSDDGECDGLWTGSHRWRWIRH